MNIGVAVDSIVGLFSPKSELERKLYRTRLAKLKNRSETYAAGKTNRMTGNWSPGNTDVNSIIKASSADVRGRVRQLVRDFPYFANAVNRLVDYTVGPGIVFQSRVQDKSGNLDKKLIQKIEDAFNFWADEADVAKKLHYYEIMQLAKRQDIESGEYIIVKRHRPKENRYLPYVLQVYESDWLTSENDKGLDDTMKGIRRGALYNIDQGVEYNRLTGEVKYYHFTDPDSWGKTIRISARDVIHGFKMLRPGQRRGISPFTPGVLLANDFGDYFDATVDVAKMAAKYLAFVKSPTPEGRQLDLNPEVNDADETKYIDDMENAIIEYLNPGEEIDIASNPNPGAQVTPFTRLIVTMLSITTDVPYELLSGDYSGMNYSTGKMSRNDFKYALRPQYARHIQGFCNPTTRPMIESAVIHGKLSLPGFYTDPYQYYRSEWQPPGMDSIDPLREAKAEIDAVKANLKSPQEGIRARGKDPEAVLKEIKQWNDWKEDYEIIDLEDISTAQANNPAAVEKEPNGKKTTEKK